MKLATLKAIVWAEFKGGQREFAKLTGISESVLSEIISGKRNPSDDQKEAIARGLGMEVWELFKSEADASGS